MKKVLSYLSIFLCANFVLTVHAAVKDIDVTVDGVTYSCSGSGSSDKYYCDCGYNQYAGYYVAYYKLDISTGEETLVKELKSVHKTKDECLNSIGKYPICK